jgi:uncharacterized protein (DUF1778 family)
MARKSMPAEPRSRKPRGTTKKSAAKIKRLEARVSAETKALFQEAAAIEGRSLSDFVIRSAIEAAQRAIRENERIELSRRDRIAFVQTLLNPPPPNARLRKAMQRHNQRVAG